MNGASVYLNFAGTTELAFRFYEKALGLPILELRRFSDLPSQEGMPPLSDSDKNMVMHVSLPLGGGVSLMGTDAPASMGFKVVQGNNFYITLAAESRAEADRVFAALSQGGQVEMPLQETFWGAYYGSLRDQFGVGWMINLPLK